MTLVHRLAWLIQRGVPAHKIVLLTFTRKAAQEMTRRAADLVGKQAASVRAGTFHSFALSALRRYAPRIGFDRSFTVLDEQGSNEYMGLARGLAAKDDEDVKRLPEKRVLKSIISKWLTSGRPLREMFDKKYAKYIGEEELFEQVALIEKAALIYQERKKVAGVMDFDDLLLKFDMLLATHPDVRESLAEDCEHILVDEYQDTDSIQVRIARQLSTVHGNIMAVGDDAQGIYGWRGAEVGNILNFSSDYPDFATTMLEDNYRSTQQILDVANAVLSRASVGYKKYLRSHKAAGRLPVLKTVQGAYAEAEFLAEQVKRRVASGESLGDIAVLFRKMAHANGLQAILQREGIPFRLVGGTSLQEANHIRDVVAILRIAINDKDELAWFRVLQFFGGVGKTTAASITMAMVAGEKANVKKADVKGNITSLISLLGDIRAFDEQDDDLRRVLDLTLQWYHPYMEKMYARDYDKRQRVFVSLRDLAKRTSSLADLVSDLALDPKPASEDGGDERVTLSTVHSAKGLEWPTVFVLSLVDGQFPNFGALKDPDALEEERRVLYVALTRAKRHLTIIRHQSRGETCRLLHGIPGKLFDHQGAQSFVGRRSNAQSRRSISALRKQLMSER